MNREAQIAEKVIDKPRVIVPFNMGTRRHPDQTKYDKRQRQRDKQELRRNDFREASVKHDDICTVDISAVESMEKFDTLREIIRQGGGRVYVESVNGDTAHVVAYENKSGKYGGGVDVPAAVLKAVVFTASDKTASEIDGGWMLPNGRVEKLRREEQHIQWFIGRPHLFNLKWQDVAAGNKGTDEMYDLAFGQGAIRLLWFNTPHGKFISAVGHREFLDRRKADLLEMAEEFGAYKLDMINSHAGMESKRTIDLLEREEDSFERAAGEELQPYSGHIRGKPDYGEREMEIAKRVAMKCDKSYKRHMLTVWGMKELSKGRSLVDVKADMAKWMKKTVEEIKAMVTNREAKMAERVAGLYDAPLSMGEDELAAEFIAYAHRHGFQHIQNQKINVRGNRAYVEGVIGKPDYTTAVPDRSGDSVGVEVTFSKGESLARADIKIWIAGKLVEKNASQSRPHDDASRFIANVGSWVGHLVYVAAYSRRMASEIIKVAEELAELQRTGEIA